MDTKDQTLEERVATLEKICDRMAVVIGTLLAMRTIVVNGALEVDDLMPVKGGNN